MSKNTTPSTRLWVLLAREAPVAVIFRRGPSRFVQLITWNLESDTFVSGQWLKGRVYEKRCDLSPDGTLLIYFAATNKEPLRSWTAVSKPPWFSALALWPKGDGWNGGGYFVGPYSIHLDHYDGNTLPHPDFTTNCEKIHIDSFTQDHGEDAPVWHSVLARDGWVTVHLGEWGLHGFERGCSWKAIIPPTWRKPHRSLRLSIEMSIERLHQNNGPWYVTRYRVIDPVGESIVDLGLIDWADWDYRGDLLFARTGSLYRQTFVESVPLPEKHLADFRKHTFEAIESPEWAKSF